MRMLTVVTLIVASTAIGLSAAALVNTSRLRSVRENDSDLLQRLIDSRGQQPTREELQNQATQLAKLQADVSELVLHLHAMTRSEQSTDPNPPAPDDPSIVDRPPDLIGTRFLSYFDVPEALRESREPTDLFVEHPKGFATIRVLDESYRPVFARNDQLEALDQIADLRFLIMDMRKTMIEEAIRSGDRTFYRPDEYQAFIATKPNLSNYHIEPAPGGHVVVYLGEGDSTEIQEVKNEIRQLRAKAGIVAVSWKSPRNPSK